MTVGRETMSEPELRAVDPIEAPQPEQPVSRATVVWYCLVGGLLVGWFFFGLLVQRQGFVDSAGESLGSAFALLLLVSIIGTVRRSLR
jgi:hypothetical protein